MGNVTSLLQSAPKEFTDVWDFILSLGINNEREKNEIYYKFVTNGIVSMDHIILLDRQYLTRMQINTAHIHLILTKLILITQGDEVIQKTDYKTIENISVEKMNKFMEDSFGGIEEELQEGEGNEQHEETLEEQANVFSSKQERGSLNDSYNNTDSNNTNKDSFLQPSPILRSFSDENKTLQGSPKTKNGSEEKTKESTEELLRKIEEIKGMVDKENDRLVKLMITTLGDKRVFFVLKSNGDCFYDIGKDNWYFQANIDIEKDFEEKYREQIKSFFKLETSYRNYSPITCAPITSIKVNHKGKEKIVSVSSFDYDSWVQGRPYDFGKMYYILKNFRCKNEKQITKEVFEKNVL